jgi:2-C-methyl-D-erythritol 4-phosphate cytidylyltransferase
MPLHPCFDGDLIIPLLGSSITMAKFAVILAAAGQSRRFNDPHYNKVVVPLAGRPLWMYATEVFSKRSDVAQIIMVISQEDRETFNEKFAGNLALLGAQVVLGGSQRADSVRNALKEVRNDIPFVAIHDAARPCLSEVWVDAVFEKAEATGAAILATPCHATLKKVDGQRTVESTIPRESVWLAQTPQVFKTELLRQAYEKHPNPSKATDESSLVEAIGHKVHIVEGSPLNIKVTTKSDLKFAELALKALPKKNPLW